VGRNLLDNPQDRAHRKVADQFIAELSALATIEEQYPHSVVRELVPSQDSMARESIEKHHIVRWVLSELDGRDPADERFDPKMTVVIELVRHHVPEEERDLFPAVKKGSEPTGTSGPRR
jgi:Hemerythrin HHE cation binding domain